MRHASGTEIDSSLNDSVSVRPRLEWRDFVHELSKLVPGLGHHPDPGTRVDEAGHLDVTERALLRQAVSSLAGRPPANLLDSITTLSEAFDWYQVRAANGTALFAEALPRESLATADVALRPLDPGDVPALYRASLDPAESYRWRFRGATPSLQQFNDALYQGTLAQFAVTDRPTGSLHGLVVVYNAMHEGGWAYVAFQRVANADARRGHMIVGIILMIDYAFRTWPFRKLYGELPSYNYESIVGSIGTPVVEEGRLKDHMYFDGNYYDMHIIAIYREAWEEFAAKWWPVLSS